MEILAAMLGRLPGPVYDTQVAAAFAGYSLQTGYGALVQALLGIRLSKEEGFADWSRRPLTPAMREYAENDVRHLTALHDRLQRVLRQRGREAWAAEHTQRLLAQAAEVTPPDDLWRRIGGRNTLDSRGLAVLRELAIWRDEEARRRDKPRRTVIKDEALVDIARRAPRSAADVLALRSAPHNLGDRAAEAITAAVKRGVAVPDAKRPRPEVFAPVDDQGAALVELLSAVVRVRAMEENLPPSLLAGGDDLRALAANRRSAGTFASDLFAGWRGQLLGDDLRAVLAGNLAVSWDTRAGRLRLVRTDHD
jgi:ribonuclease D